MGILGNTGVGGRTLPQTNPDQLLLLLSPLPIHPACPGLTQTSLHMLWPADLSFPFAAAPGFTGLSLHTCPEPHSPDHGTLLLLCAFAPGKLREPWLLRQPQATDSINHFAIELGKGIQIQTCLAIGAEAVSRSGRLAHIIRR